MVTVVVIAYNHSSFIKECLKNIVKQSTKYSFNCMIADDCSNDSSHQIINSFVKKYPKISLSKLEEGHIELGADNETQYIVTLNKLGRKFWKKV